MLSIIIVHYKTLKLTAQTLTTVFASEIDEAFEVIVVDNASNDGSLEELKVQFPQVVFIENTENAGFARANNQGIKISQGEYVLLLNSDVALESDTLQGSLRYLKNHSEIGALGIKLMLPDGTLDHTCKRGFPTPLSSLYYFTKVYKRHPKSKHFGHYTQSFIHQDEVAPVDAIVGAYMLLPKRVIEEVGMLNEDYFMYGEDLDWCYRIKQAGYQVMYFPVVRAIHYKGGSGRNFRVNRAFYGAMWRFYKTHYLKTYSWFTTALVATGIFFMWLVKSAVIGLRSLKHD